MRTLLQKTLFITCLSVSATPALAEGTFNGFNAQLGVGVSSLDSDNYWDDYGTYKTAQEGVLGSVAVGYSHGFDNHFNLNANIFKSFGSDQAGRINISGGDKEQNRLKNMAGITVEPGYYLSNDTLAYLKLGAATATSNYENPGDNTYYKRTYGIQYGAGLKKMVSDRLYIGGEAYQIDFASRGAASDAGERNNNKPSATYAGLVLGYNFSGTNQSGSDDDSFTTNTGFDGPFLQAGGGFSSINIDSDYEGDIYKMGEKSLQGAVAAGYSHGFGKRFNIAGSIFHNFGTDDAGAIDYIPSYSTHRDHWQLDDVWGATIEPGYYLSDNALGYIKLGYVNAHSFYEGTYLSKPTENGRSDGLLYGLGLKQKVTDNIYAGVEAYNVRFEKKDWPANGIDTAATNRPSMNYAGVLLGYSF